MRHYIALALAAFVFCSNSIAQTFQPYQMPNSHVIPISDSKAGMQYELYIKLPDDYAENAEKTYPVLYYTDAVWHIDILSAATSFLLDEVILVGISWQKDVSEDLKQEYGESASRFSDYSFWTKVNPNHPKLQFGGANKHMDFLTQDVIPYVENHFRIDKTKRSYFGYSLGGLFGAYILVKAPKTFDNYILGSVSMRLLLDESAPTFHPLGDVDANVLFTRGDQEIDRAEHIAAFVTQLKTKNSPQKLSSLMVIPGNHQTAFPETSIASIKWLADIVKEAE